MEENVDKERIHCSDDVFMQAVFSSKTYVEISEKTGQKITTTMARYARIKSALASKGIQIPKMNRKKPERQIDKSERLVQIYQRLKEHHHNM